MNGSLGAKNTASMSPGERIIVVSPTRSHDSVEWIILLTLHF